MLCLQSIRANTLLAPGTQFKTNDVPSFSGDGAVTRIRHQEYITDVTSSVSFVNNSYLINPGNPNLCRWLSKIAANFEEFEFKGLIFMFKSTSATAVGSTNTGLGTLVMATDYDVVDTNYGSKVEMEISDFAVSGVPSSNYLHPVECDTSQNVMGRLFVNSATSINQYPDDPRFSCQGNFQIATVGMQAASNIGELWVAYDVELRKPQINTVNSHDFAWHCGFSYDQPTNSTTGNTISTSPAGDSTFTVAYSVTAPQAATITVTSNVTAPFRALIVTSNLLFASIVGTGDYGTAPVITLSNGCAYAPIGIAQGTLNHNADATNVVAGENANHAYPYTGGAQVSYSIVDFPHSGSSYKIQLATALTSGTASNLSGDLYITGFDSLVTSKRVNKEILSSRLDRLEETLKRLSAARETDESDEIGWCPTPTPSSSSSSSSSCALPKYRNKI